MIPRSIRTIATCVVAATMMASTMAVRPQAASAALTVRLYNTSRVPTGDLLAARHTAESILRDTGLNVTFRHCARPLTPGSEADPCADRLKPLEVVVRVIHAPAFSTALHPDAYGVSYVVQETNRGWLATVFSDRIDQAAARVGVEAGTLLGRVMAHEVGHLLLGTTYHGEAGLMRAEWPDAVLRRAGEEWRFSTVEAARMHSLVASATRAPLETGPASAAF